VDQYLASAQENHPELRKRIADAMRYYELALQAWDLRADPSSWNGTDSNILRACEPLRRISQNEIDLASSARKLGMLGYSEISVDGKPAYTFLWSCAADQIK